jgi:membrane protein implicated in regulation of membrane protease activity
VGQLIGEKCTVTSRIENLAGNGEVKAGGLYWAARAAVEDQIFEVGATVTVIAVEGVKLICK